MSTRNHRMKSKRREWWLESWPKEGRRDGKKWIFMQSISPTLAKQLDKAGSGDEQYRVMRRARSRAMRSGSRLVYVPNQFGIYDVKDTGEIPPGVTLGEESISYKAETENDEL